jgi:phospholipase/lecithinase/hemolysin
MWPGTSTVNKEIDMNEGKMSGTRTFVLAAMLLTGLPAVSNAQGAFEDVFIFGDSLSDGGNIYALTGETSKAPYALVPTLPYAIGGHHYSNGKTWVERLAQDLGDSNGGKPSLKNPGKHGNYAHGGARARLGSGNSSPSSAEQVDAYLMDYGYVADPNALYVLQFGGNDLRDALEAGAKDPAAVGPILNAAVMEFIGSIQMLYGYGARHFLVANAPNLAQTPAIKMAGAEVAAIAGFLTGEFNDGLAGGLYLLDMGIPNINIYQLDVAQFTNDVVANPGDFGLTDTDSPCLNFFVASDSKCDNPEERMFWDGFHPTAAAHNALAAEALGVVYGN